MNPLFAELEKRPDGRLEKDATDRSIIIGLICTALFHLLLVWFSPEFAFENFSGVHSGISVTNTNRSKSFDFELAEPLVPPEEKEPFRFVETNPDAPENTPDDTVNFSNRNQQSAQPDPVKELDAENRPSIKGQEEIQNSSSIVSGDMAPPQLGAAPTPENARDDARDQREQLARAAQIPLAGIEKTEGLSDDGIATNISTLPAPGTPAKQAVDGAPDATDSEGALVALPEMSRAQPRTRPRLTQPRPAILSNRVTGVSNMGILGMDARWSEYGEYLQQVIEIVQAKWYGILGESQVAPPRGSHVAVTFKINAKGETQIVKVEDTDSGRQGVFSCQNAITYPQPYRKWTDQMIAVLGDSQELTFVFYY